MSAAKELRYSKPIVYLVRVLCHSRHYPCLFLRLFLKVLYTYSFHLGYDITYKGTGACFSSTNSCAVNVFYKRLVRKGKVLCYGWFMFAHFFKEVPSSVRPNHSNLDLIWASFIILRINSLNILNVTRNHSSWTQFWRNTVNA